MINRRINSVWQLPKISATSRLNKFEGWSSKFVNKKSIISIVYGNSA